MIMLKNHCVLLSAKLICTCITHPDSPSLSLNWNWAALQDLSRFVHSDATLLSPAGWSTGLVLAPCLQIMPLHLSTLSLLDCWGTGHKGSEVESQESVWAKVEFI